jgi:butyryl-CoA dehydrogenase
MAAPSAGSWPGRIKTITEHGRDKHDTERRTPDDPRRPAQLFAGAPGPNAARWDREHHFPKEELKELAALGAFGVAVPEALGGAGLDYVSLALVLEEIAAGDGGTSTIISVNNCPVCSIAMMYANDRQKQQWLRPLAQGEMLGAFCLTEPHTGSDAAALRTTATRDGDEYVINGTKQFITSGKYGDVAIVMAVTDKAAGKKGISAFWVPTYARATSLPAGAQDGPALVRHGADSVR